RKDPKKIANVEGPERIKRDTLGIAQIRRDDARETIHKLHNHAISRAVVSVNGRVQVARVVERKTARAIQPGREDCDAPVWSELVYMCTGVRHEYVAGIGMDACRQQCCDCTK